LAPRMRAYGTAIENPAATDAFTKSLRFMR
jgi:hypothetical protein